MGFFNFVENFFLISLGITFVLILLLVYHFKQRVSSMERKGETMFELLRSMVNEINILKRVNCYFGGGGSSCSVPIEPANVLPEINMTVIHPPSAENSSPEDDNDDDTYTEEGEEDVESDANSESESEEEMSDSDSEKEEEEKNEEEVLEVDEDDLEECSLGNKEQENGEDNLEEVEMMDMDGLEVDNLDELSATATILPETVFSNPLFLTETDYTPSSPHSVSSEKSDHVLYHQIADVPISDLNMEILLPNESANHDVVPEISNLEDLENPVGEVSVSVPTVEQPIEKSSPTVEEDQVRKDSYRKMNLHQLKAVVQTLGIQADTSKMKKNEILKLLGV